MWGEPPFWKQVLQQLWTATLCSNNSNTTDWLCWFEATTDCTARISTAGVSAAGPPTIVVSQTQQQVSRPAFVPDRKNPGVAAVLSFFWAGLGQIYNGQLMKGIGFIVLYAFSVLLCFVLIGFIILPIVWFIGIWDAYSTAKSYNDRMFAGFAQ